MKDGIVIIGSSGHAKVVIETLRAAGRNAVYCVSNGAGASTCAGVPVLFGDGELSKLREAGYEKAIIAVGSNPIRARLAIEAERAGFSLTNAINPHAVVSLSAVIGNGVVIMAGAIVNAESKVSDLAIINTGATVDHDCNIGYAAHIAPQCALAGNVRVGKYSFLGIGTKVIPGISIGDNVTVGAGAVVVRDLADGSLALGVPARTLA